MASKNRILNFRIYRRSAYTSNGEVRICPRCKHYGLRDSEGFTHRVSVESGVWVVDSKDRCEVPLVAGWKS